MSSNMIKPIRWGDHDHYFGPITYAREDGCPVAMVIDSGELDYPGCHLRICAFGHTLILALPFIVKPYREKIHAESWDAETVKRMGRDWYWNEDSREFGFTYSDGFLNVYLGRQSHDSSTEKRWSYFVPWANWRHVRTSMYGLSGEHYCTSPQKADYLKEQTIKDACPSISFEFDDFDGQRLTARTHIEEMEWRFGTKWCRWMSWFSKPKIRRSLEINFSGETGNRKGSWKGGTIGCGIDIDYDELHESAFRRYCDGHQMKFAGIECLTTT